jgi:hypothetical protein
MTRCKKWSSVDLIVGLRMVHADEVDRLRAKLRQARAALEIYAGRSCASRGQRGDASQCSDESGDCCASAVQALKLGEE